MSTDAALSLSESVQRLERATPGVQSRVPEPIGTSIDERTGEVVMDVFIEGGPEQAEKAKSRIEAARADLAQAIGLPVRIQYLPSPMTSGTRMVVPTSLRVRADSPLDKMERA